MSNPALIPVRSVQGGGWLRPLAANWPSALCTELEIAPAVVRVVVAGVRGSSPREPGTCMLVSRNGSMGTIGGGHLEWLATRFACELLDGNDPAAAQTKRLVLGTQLGQCCGGVVELWVERYTHRDLPLLRIAAQAASGSEPVLMAIMLGAGGVTRRVMQAATPAFLPPHLRPAAEALLASGAPERVRYFADSVLLERLNPATTELWLYGAGHVGQALIRVLSELPLRVTWIDSRAGFLPRRVAPNIRTMLSTAPAQDALTAPRSARHLVMTHDHALDYEICRSLLRQDELAWLGLIGSSSKGAKFRARLQRDGISSAAIDRLVCPVGIEGVEGKAPAIVAIAIAAQLLQTMSDPAEVALAPEMPLLARAKASGERVANPLSHYAFGDCTSGNCESCGTHRSAAI